MHADRDHLSDTEKSRQQNDTITTITDRWRTIVSSIHNSQICSCIPFILPDPSAEQVVAGAEVAWARADRDHLWDTVR